MSAAFNDGASLTPSPVIAHILPFASNALTIATLFSGETLAKTLAVLHVSCNCSGDISSTSLPSLH